MNLSFAKYQGTGNDFVMVDNRARALEKVLTREQVAHICDRRFGIGADGLILLSDDPEVDFRMIYYNSDGGESTMCGNGGRCLVAYAHQKGIQRDIYRFQAVDGIHEGILEDTGVRLSMINPHGFAQLSEDNYWINTGSPHYVRFASQAVEEMNLYEIGKEIRYSDAYAAIGGTNVNLVNRLGPAHLQVRTYERGVEGETLSCGTGVTACAYVSLLASQPDHMSEVLLDTPGGQLRVKVDQLGQPNEKIWLAGPATFVFEGQIELDM